MVRPALASTVLVCAASLTAIAQKPESPPDLSPQEKIPLPRSVRIEKDDSGNHTYVIAGLSWNSDSSRQRSKGVEPLLPKTIPACLSARLDTVARRLTIVTSRPLADLPKTVDRLALFGIGVPHWDELMMRDKRAPQQSEGLYRLVFTIEPDFQSQHPFGMDVHATSAESDNTLSIRFFLRSVRHDRKQAGLEIHTLRYDNGRYHYKRAGTTAAMTWEEKLRTREKHPTERPIRYGPSRKGIVRINKSTGYCKVHSRFALRIFDEKDRYIWEDLENLYGECRLLVHDFDGNGTDEICCYRDDHGRGTLLVFATGTANPRKD
jgi:hypothetical protein